MARERGATLRVGPELEIPLVLALLKYGEFLVISHPGATGAMAASIIF